MAVFSLNFSALSGRIRQLKAIAKGVLRRVGNRRFAVAHASLRNIDDPN
jgi:hypothetical protein